MKDYELLAKALKRYWPSIRYGEDKVEINNKIALPVPRRLMPIIRQALNPNEPIPEELDEILPYVLEIVEAFGEVDLIASTPKEREFKIVAGIECLKDKRQQTTKRKTKRKG